MNKTFVFFISDKKLQNLPSLTAVHSLFCLSTWSFHLYWQEYFYHLEQLFLFQNHFSGLALHITSASLFLAFGAFTSVFVSFVFKITWKNQCILAKMTLKAFWHSSNQILMTDTLIAMFALKKQLTLMERLPWPTVRNRLLQQTYLLGQNWST